MKIFFTLILFTLALFLALFFISHTDTQEIKINASYYNVFQQVQKPTNWKRVLGNSFSVKKLNDKAFKIQDLSSSMVITYLGGNLFNFTLDRKGKEETFYIQIDFNSQPRLTGIHILRRTNLLTWLLNPGPSPALKTHIQDLKAFMENTQAYYGYPIHIEKELDSNIVVLKKIVPVSHLYSEARKLRLTLDSYLNIHKIIQTSPLIAEFGILEHDSVRAMIGIPVSVRVKPSAGFEFMKMPAGRILSATYTGRYSQRKKVYTAMRTYIQDQSMQTVVQPYEKFLSNHLPGSDSSSVTIKVNFPVL